LHTAQLMPLPLTVSCFSTIQIGFTFLVPAHPGSRGKRAIKKVFVCVLLSINCRSMSLQVDLTMNYSAAVPGAAIKSVAWRRRKRSISPARRAHSSKPAACYCSRRMEQTDGQTDGWTPTVTQTLPHTIRALSKIQLTDLYKSESAIGKPLTAPCLEHRPEMGSSKS